MEDRYSLSDGSVSGRYQITDPPTHDLGTGSPSYPRGSRRERRGYRRRVKGDKFSDRVRESLKRSKKYHKKPEK